MSVREAAAAAETVGERVIKGDELKVHITTHAGANL